MEVVGRHVHSVSSRHHTDDLLSQDAKCCSGKDCVVVAAWTWGIEIAVTCATFEVH